MSAQKVYYAKRAEEKPEKPVRSMMELVKGMVGEKIPNWDELAGGERGWKIGGIAFGGLQPEDGKRRDLGTGTGAGGGYLSKKSQPVDFIPAMLAQSKLGQAGAKSVKPGGDWSAIPAVASIASLGWIDPNGGGTMSENVLTFGSRLRSPKLGTFSADVSRALRIPAGGLAERLIELESARVIAAGIDAAALNGAGVDAEPLGLLNAGIPSTSGASYAWATACEQVRAVEAANGTPSAWFASPATGKILRGRAKASGTSDFILGDDGKILGMPCFISTGMPDNSLICGDFSRLSLHVEEVEVLFDPYTQSNTGTISLVYFVWCDVVVEHLTAFIVAVNVS